MKKIQLNYPTLTIAEAFENFLYAKSAQGVTDKTIEGYRTWVIINFILNSGARSSTIRAIKVCDVDLKNGIVTFRHNKNHKIQIIPLCSQMTTILAKYMHYRNGSEEDYLFCTEEGQMLMYKFIQCTHNESPCFQTTIILRRAVSDL